MYNRLAIFMTALALTVTTAAFAQTIDVGGRVVRVDPGTQIIVLDNNQAYRITPDTMLLINNQPVSLSAVQPGQMIVIRPGASSATVTSPAPAVVTAPGSTVVAGPPAAQVGSVALAQQTIQGRVTDVDRGEIKIKTDHDSFEVKVPREVAAQVRKGDTVRLDLTFLR